MVREAGVKLLAFRGLGVVHPYGVRTLDTTTSNILLHELTNYLNHRYSCLPPSNLEAFVKTRKTIRTPHNKK